MEKTLSAPKTHKEPQTTSSGTDKENALPDENLRWYKDAIIYELHIKAFNDSNKDGIGDFEGLTAASSITLRIVRALLPSGCCLSTLRR